MLGFEYGFSIAAPDELVLWEAQYGDFVNVAQPIIDQFISADRAKWRQESGLVLLLPHGYEGQGPEHSSARLERFLQLCAEGNMVVAYPSTPAQYFHILRRQALRRPRRPLVLMQPKSLLRLPAAASKLEELASGTFQPVIDDPVGVGESRRGAAPRVLHRQDVLRSHRRGERPANVAIVRVEELYPWPRELVREIVDRYPNVEEVVWAQEEPKNMGAWTLRAAAAARVDGTLTTLRYIGRPERASPAEGYKARTRKSRRASSETCSRTRRRRRRRRARRAKRTVADSFDRGSRVLKRAFVGRLSLLIVLAAPRLAAQERGAAALGEAGRGARHDERVLMIGAHPDDEDTQLITWLARRGTSRRRISRSRAATAGRT